MVLKLTTVGIEIKFFNQSEYFSGLAKKHFLVQQMFFGSKYFFTIQIQPDSQKQFGSKQFRSKW